MSQPCHWLRRRRDHHGWQSLPLWPRQLRALRLPHAERDGVQTINLRVERDLAPLQDALELFLPNARVQAEAMNDHIVLSGSVPSASDADAALRIAQRWVDDPENILSMISVQAREQVMLKVRIVEMRRDGVGIDGCTHNDQMEALRLCRRFLCGCRRRRGRMLKQNARNSSSLFAFAGSSKNCLWRTKYRAKSVEGAAPKLRH